MAVTPGTRLGVHDIAASIGAGGIPLVDSGAAIERSSDTTLDGRKFLIVVTAGTAVSASAPAPRPDPGRAELGLRN